MLRPHLAEGGPVLSLVYKSLFPDGDTGFCAQHVYSQGKPLKLAGWGALLAPHSCPQ